MTRFLLIILFNCIFFLSHAQSYSQLWQKVDSLIYIKNYKQSADLLSIIREKAIRENNIPEKIRTILAEHNSLTINLSNTESINAISKHFENHTQEAKGIERNILANFYAQYLLNNISIQKVDSESFYSLPIEQRTEIIDSLFKISLEDKEKLQKEKLNDWQTLLKTKEEIILIPTVYHLLALCYVDFLQFDSSKDSLRKTIEDDIQQFNKKNNYVDASAYLTYRPYIKNSFYYQVDSLTNILPNIKSDFNAHIYYLIARQKDPKEALKLLRTAKENYPKSAWIQNVDTLYEQLSSSAIRAEIPTFAPSQEYTPIDISHKNSDRLFIRVHDISNKFKTTNFEKTKYDPNSYQVNTKAPLIYEESINLKNFDDPYEHNTIYKINPLPYGRYQILVSNNEDFKEDGVYLKTISSDFYVTDLFISTYEQENKKEQANFIFSLLDRKSGNPKANAVFQLYAENDKDGKLKKVKKYKTNQAGEFTFNSTALDYDVDEIWLYTDQEKQWIALSEINEIPDLSEEIQNEDLTHDNKGILMTDRAIYRPGQPLFFKAVLYSSHYKNGKVMANQELSVRLKDANGQEIKKQTLNTNTFGSVNGRFDLPNPTLNGHFYLELFLGDKRIEAKHFRVEEYKRPTFKVSFEPNKNTYTNVDTAIFTGKVESLTGTVIPNSTVNYKINTYSYSPYSEYKKEGAATSDSLGNFTIPIPFTDSIYRDSKDIYLSIQADVISPSEEIQTAYTNYTYSKQPKRLSISTQSYQKESLWNNINVSTTNSNGFPLPFAGQIHIYKYENINLPLGDYAIDFNKDYDLLDSSSYQKYFPNHYDKALHVKERRKKLIVSYPFDSNISSKVTIDSTLFDYGEYLIEGISIVGESDTLRSTQNVKIYNAETRKYSDNTFLTYAFDKIDYQENDTATLTFYTDLKEANSLILWKILGTDILPAHVLTFDQGKAVYQFVVQEADKFPKPSFEAVLLKDNKIKRLSINVPYEQESRKNIKIISKSFRDKITPGQKEKWSFSIQQNESKSEVLATMYDNSLDQFASNDLSNNFYFNYPYYPYHRLSHISVEFQEKSIWTNYAQYKNKTFKPFVLPEIRNYDLWSNSTFPYNRLFTRRDKNKNSFFESVEVYGYGSQTLDSSTATLDEVVVMSSSLAGKVAGLDVEGFAHGQTNGVEGVLYDELKDPSLRQEVENLKNKNKEDLFNAVRVRSDLKETAFFYPALYTDEDGNVSFEFDSPEALTKWKLLLFAHTEDLQSGNATFYTHTQKQLMVQPNLPRFVRVGDKILIKSLIHNLSDETINGKARLQFIDPQTNSIIANIFVENNDTKDFDISAKNNTTVSWMVDAPEGYPTVIVKVIAATDEYSDGEQQELVIIPNDILISETEKIILATGQQKEFQIASNGKKNLQAQLIVQANPILEILSSLDYLKNYPYECAEQTASKWFGIKMIQYMQKHYPQISNYFNNLDTVNISSSLREKASLSELSLVEMPWLRSIMNEEEKLKQLAVLFNTKNSENDLKVLEKRLDKLQNKDGSFVWFDGGKANFYISIRLLEIFGKVHQLDDSLLSKDNQRMITKLKSYLNKENSLNATSSYSQVVDLAYALQYWKEELKVNKEQKAILLKILRNAPKSTAKQAAGLAAKSWIVTHQLGLQSEADAIFNRLDQEYVKDSIAGIYWKSNSDYYNAVSLQSYLIEAYKIMKPEFLNPMTDWLFYNKSNNNWRTTWMSVDAIYALLVANDPRDFTVDNKVLIRVDQETSIPNQTGIGQISLNLSRNDLSTDKTIAIENTNKRKIYGSLVHQYFLPLEEVKASTKDISVKKYIMVFRNNEWLASNTIKSGDKVKIRLEVISNENLNFVHLKDNRAAGFEPIYKPSGYQFWSGGYYFTNKDASTNYFIDYLPKGRHVFEYEVKTNNIGIFNSGISQIECMYNPAIHARSENVKVQIKE